MEDRDQVEHRLDEQLQRGVAQVRDHVRVADVEAEQQALGPDPLSQAADAERAGRNGLGPGEDRA